jgi:hypothetical protein
MDERPWFGAGARLCAASDVGALRAGARLAPPAWMDRNPPTYIELSLDDDDELAPTTVAENVWFDEKTSRIDFDRQTLSAEAKLVIGYLTMEQNGMFAELSFEEQQKVAETLKR